MEQLALKPKAIYTIANVKFFNKYFAFDIPTLA